MKKHTALGHLIASYSLQPLTWRRVLLLIVPWIVIVLVLYGIGVWRQSYAAMKYGPAAVATWGTPWYQAATLFLIPTLGVSLMAISKANTRITFYKKGVRIEKPFRKPVLLFWEQIYAISTHIKDQISFGSRNQILITIHPYNGKPLKLRINPEKSPEILARLKANIYPRVKPNLLEQLDQDKAVDFGAIQISRYLLISDKLRIPWSKVRYVDIRQNRLMIELIDNNQKIEMIHLHKVYNPELLLELIRDEVHA